MDDNKLTKGRLRAANCSLVLFILGFLVPLVIFLAVPKPPDTGTVAFTVISIAVGGSLICELLAVVLGIVGWRHVQGKIGTIGSIIILLITLKQ